MFGNTQYVLNKIFLGGEDSFSVFGMGENDDVQWVSPWEKIFFSPSSYYVFGQGEDESKIIGFVHHTENSFQVELTGGYQRIPGEQNIVFLDSKEVIVPVIEACPNAMARLGEVSCNGYVKIYNILVSIDFAAMGEVAPDVARDVVSGATVAKLVESALLFSPDVDTIRTEFLIPILLSIKNLKQMSEMTADDDGYLEKTRETYSTLLITSLDSAIKIQKMAPEAFKNINNIALGSALAYLGAEGAGDAVISRKQPPWFEEVVAPVIREVGVLSIDLILNGSETPFDARLKRFMDMERQVSNAITRLCKESPTANQNECLNALSSR